jgi:hypothetical protein
MGSGESPRGEGSTIHERHYTVDEANALLPSVKPLLRRLRDAKDQLTESELHEELEEAGIVVRDIDRGLIDFPAIREGNEVYLCWELGEDAVEHWHDMESGYRGRQQLDD